MSIDNDHDQRVEQDPEPIKMYTDRQFRHVKGQLIPDNNISSSVKSKINLLVFNYLKTMFLSNHTACYSLSQIKECLFRESKSFRKQVLLRYDRYYNYDNMKDMTPGELTKCRNGLLVFTKMTTFSRLITSFLDSQGDPVCFSDDGLYYLASGLMELLTHILSEIARLRDISYPKVSPIVGDDDLQRALKSNKPLLELFA
jgi:hypothetical protein